MCAGLLNRGWRVFAGQYMPDWPELGALAGQFLGSLHIVPLDVSSLESVQAAARTVSEMADHLDMLINNAGIGGGHGDLREGLDFAAMQHRLTKEID